MLRLIAMIMYSNEKIENDFSRRFQSLIGYFGIVAVHILKINWERSNRMSLVRSLWESNPGNISKYILITRISSLSSIHNTDWYLSCWSSLFVVCESYDTLYHAYECKFEVSGNSTRTDTLVCATNETAYVCIIDLKFGKRHHTCIEKRARSCGDAMALFVVDMNVKSIWSFSFRALL